MHFTTSSKHQININDPCPSPTIINPKSAGSSPTAQNKSSFVFPLQESPTLKPNSQSLAQNARTQLWTLALYTSKIDSNLVRSDRDIELVVLDLPNQSVLNNDCMRTRGNSFTPNLKASLEKMLTFYCKQERITYKQGLHELGAPFILFLENGLSLSEIYNLFVLFIDKYLPNFYLDKEFLSLQCCLRALSLLLKYHDPSLHNFLITNYFTPEIFSTPWFLTLFASKLNLNMVYLLWDLYLFEQDPYFIFFLAVGLLMENRNKIMNTSLSMVPEILACLTIETRDQLKRVYKRARSLKLSTPQSFGQKLQEMHIVVKVRSRDKQYRMAMQHNLEYLERITCLMLSPYELLQNLYPQAIGCANPCCNSYYVDSSKDRIESNSSNYKDSSLTTEYSGKRITNQARVTMNIDDKTSPTLFLSQEKKEDPQAPFLCSSCAFKASPANHFILEKSMTHLTDILKDKGIFRDIYISQTYNLEFYVLDLRGKKDNGYLPKARCIDPFELKAETANKIVEELLRIKDSYHIVLMVCKFDSLTTTNAESLFSLEQAEQQGCTDENVSLSKLLATLNNKGVQHISIVEGGFQKIAGILEKKRIKLLKHNSSCTFKPHVKTRVSSISTEDYSNSNASTLAGQSPTFHLKRESFESLSSFVQRPKTPNPVGLGRVRQESWQQENDGNVEKGHRTKSTLKNGRKVVDAPLNSKIDLQTPRRQSAIQLKLHGIGHNGEVDNKNNLPDTPKVHLKTLLIKPVIKPVNHGGARIFSRPSTPSILNASRDGSRSDQKLVTASREIFQNKPTDTSTSLLKDSDSPLLRQSPENKHSGGFTVAVSNHISLPGPNSGKNSPLNEQIQHKSEIKSIFGARRTLADIPSSLGLSAIKGRSRVEKDSYFLQKRHGHREGNMAGTVVNDRKNEREESQLGYYSNKILNTSNMLQEDTDNNCNNMIREIKTGHYSEYIHPNSPEERKDKFIDIYRKADKILSQKRTNHEQFNTNAIRLYDAKATDKSVSEFYGRTSADMSLMGRLSPLEVLEKTGEEPSNSRNDSTAENFESKYSESRFPFNKLFQNSLSPEGRKSRISNPRASVCSITSTELSGDGNGNTRLVLQRRGEKYLFGYLGKRSFCLYVCTSYHSKSQDKDQDNGKDSYASRKSILIISHDLFIAIQFNQSVFDRLTLLQKKVSSKQSPQHNQSEKDALEDQSLLEIHVSGDTKEEQDDIVYFTVLPMKLLLKVTSKKLDPKYISVYFRMPNTERVAFQKFHKVFDPSNINSGELFRMAENYELDRMLDLVRSYKEEKNFTEIKKTYCLERQEAAHQCIIKIQEAYRRHPTLDT